ncbi:hypothetical protein D3C76_1581030 [compost metagenome]
MIVVVLLRQFKYGFTAFEIMTRNDACIVELVQYTVNGSQTNFFAHVDQTFV